MLSKLTTSGIVSALCLLVAVGPVWSAEPDVRYVADQVLMRTQLGVEITSTDGAVTSNDTTLAAALAELNVTGLKVVIPASHPSGLINRTYLLTLKENSDVIAAAAALSKLEAVTSAQPNYASAVSRVPSDANWSQLWGLQKIDCETGWDIFTGSRNVVIAVTDTGVDYTHPDLTANMWNNLNEVPNNGLDDDNNGVIDDYYGYDAVFDDGDPQDTTHEDHGTHCSGTIGAVANNTKSGINICGVNWSTQIMAVRISSDGYMYDDDILSGTRYAADMGADVISMSWGGYWATDAENDIMQYAYQKGCMLIAAAGNDSTSMNSYPACYDNVMAVSATDESDKKAWFSNYGEWVDIAAPGVNILSTITDGDYAVYQGTSMACPHVAGAAGLLIAYGRSFSPAINFTPDQVAAYLTENTDNIDSENPGYIGKLGTGRLNVQKMLDAVDTSYEMPDILTALEIRQVVDGDEITEDMTVDEHTSAQFKAYGYRSNTLDATDMTDKVQWVVRPTRYGTFDTATPGKFNASLVPADRQVTITISYTEDNRVVSRSAVITVLEDPEVAPLEIVGPTQVDPGSETSYTASYMEEDGTLTDVTQDVKWEITDGTSDAAFDNGRAGYLIVDPSAISKTLTLKASLLDETNNVLYTQTHTVTTTAQSRQVSGLFLTGAQRVAAGSTSTWTSKLLFSDGSSQDVTPLATWTVSPSSAGEFTSPGRLVAAAVSASTDAVLTSKYVYNGIEYTAQLVVTILPATAVAKAIDKGDDDENEGEVTTTEDGSLVDEFTAMIQSACPVAGMLTIAGVMLAGFHCSGGVRRKN